MKTQDTLTRVQRKELDDRGWILIQPKYFSIEEQTQDLIDIAHALGSPVAGRQKGALVETLSPVSTDHAHQNSLSAQFETAEFPLHADTAHWTTPCRYIAMSCACNGSADRATTLLDTHNINLQKQELELLHTAVFSVTNGRNSFFSSILSPKRQFIRYDPGCMKATSSSADAAMKIFNSDRWQQSIDRIQWETGMTVVIDNWRMLHGRESSASNDSTRTLLRVLIQ